MDASTLDPSELSVDELRARRAELQAIDDAISYVRRLVQARLDIVLAEKRLRAEGDELLVPDDLREILGHHLTGGPARPPRPAHEASDHPLAIELDQLCSDLGANHVSQLSDDELATLSDALEQFEQARSIERQAVFARLDALSAELVRRYRDGEASVDGLMADE